MALHAVGEESRQVQEARLGGTTAKWERGKAPGSDTCFKGCGQSQVPELQQSKTPFASELGSAPPAPRGAPA